MTYHPLPEVSRQFIPSVMLCPAQRQDKSIKTPFANKSGNKGDGSSGPWVRQTKQRALTANTRPGDQGLLSCCLCLAATTLALSYRCHCKCFDNFVTQVNRPFRTNRLFFTAFGRVISYWRNISRGFICTVAQCKLCSK